MTKDGNHGIPVPSYTDDVSNKVVKIIQSYVGVVNKMVWRKEIQALAINICQYKLNLQQYLCEVFRRLKNTVEDEFVYLLLHKWQP